MTNKASMDVLVLGSGPGALAIAAALSKEKLTIQALSASEPSDPWPYTYGIWGQEVDELGLNHLLEHRWKNTVSFFGEGSTIETNKKNIETKHNKDYGLFDKRRLQEHWLNECKQGKVEWHKGIAVNLQVNKEVSTVTTADGRKLEARLVVDATGYEPVFLKSEAEEEIAVQTCYGIVGRFNKSPMNKGQFILMDYRCDHLNKNQRKEPPTFLYAMDMGKDRFFLEETSLGLYPPLTLEVLKERLNLRLAHRGIEITELEHEELGLFLPMNKPIPDLNQPIIGFGGAAAMVHPASGYLVGGLLRRAPIVAKAISNAMNNKNASPEEIAKQGWTALWPTELRRKHALYIFGIEKLMRFEEEQLREFFKSFFELPNDQWYGFLTNTLSVMELVNAMWTMFKTASWKVKWGLMGMQGREIRLLWNFISPRY